MKQIKKLARRGMARTLGLLGAIFLGVAVLFGLLSAGQGIETMLIMIMTMGLMFFLVFLIFGLVGVVPYARIGKMVKRQCEELGIELDEEQEFEAVTKEISMSKNWLVSGLYGSNFALHRRSIDHVEETSYYQKGRTYPMILLYVGPKKKYKIICSRKGDFERVTDALDQWFPPLDTPDNAEALAATGDLSAEDDRQARRDRIMQQEQGMGGKKTVAAIVAVVGMVIAFSVIYNILPSRTSAPKTTPNVVGNSQTSKPAAGKVNDYIASIQDEQFQQVAKGLMAETDGDADLVKPLILSEENNQTYFAVYNGTPYFFYGEMTVYDENDKVIGTLEIPLAKPYEYCFLSGYAEGGADSYDYTAAEFYSLSYAGTNVRYQFSLNNDDTSDWSEILLATENMKEANVQEICEAEYYSNVLSRIVVEELFFFDENELSYINDNEEEGLDRAAAKYRAVLDIDRGVIEWYSINNGSETALSSITMK
ncbi:hypothetical protein [Holdemania massiliensis]|uniref:hypothetical protein n=1 Tax=Holdemania massiliensis TaxID=1468449 RepID=UPI001F060A66|nr:hypothetical protein [Holdemania massiliensis]MCH1942591.1 hypothetical protein [Holdemania massiliensis]